MPVASCKVKSMYNTAANLRVSANKYKSEGKRAC